MKFLRLVLLAARQRLDRVNAIDRAANISPEAWVSGCTIGPDVSVGNGCKLYRATLVGKVSISRYTSLWGPEIYAGAGEHGISVGSFCSIAHHVSLQEVFHNPQRTTTLFVNGMCYRHLRRLMRKSAKGQSVLVMMSG